MAFLDSVCVYCGASVGNRPAYRQAGEALGRALAREGIRLVFGGGSVGIMGAVATACMEAGGSVVGIIPEHLDRREIAHGGLSELIVVPDMHTRKRTMFEKADAFVVLPGGFGTLDEMFEILTWKQLDLHCKPVILANVEGVWEPLLRTAESLCHSGFVPRQSLGHYRVVDAVEDIIPVMRDELSLWSRQAVGE